MSVPNLHHISAVRLGKAAPVTLGGIGSQRVNTNTDVVGDALSGEVYNRWASIRSQKPVFDFMTKAILTGLANVPLTGLDIVTVLTGTDKLSLFGQKVAEGGTRDAGAVHRLMKGSKGLVVLGSLSCQHQQDAELTLTTILTYDGTNDPIVVADNVSLPAGIVDTERFSLGPIFLNAIAVTGHRSVNVNFGVQAVSEGSESEIWDRFAYIREIMAEITIAGVDVSLLAAAKIPLIGVLLTQPNPPANTNTRIFFRKRASGGTFVADGTAVHVRLNAAGLAYVETPFDGSGNAPGTATVRIKCHFDGLQPPIAVSTAVAIA